MTNFAQHNEEMICHEKDKIAGVLKMTITLGDKLVTVYCKETALLMARGLDVGINLGSVTPLTHATFSVAWLEWCLKCKLFPS
jgi:hypothetical protein